MKLGYLLVASMLAMTSAQAVDADRLMRELAWKKRVLLVFAPNDRHAAYRHQAEILDALGAGLRERDLTVIEAFAGKRVVIQ